MDHESLVEQYESVLEDLIRSAQSELERSRHGGVRIGPIVINTCHQLVNKTWQSLLDGPPKSHTQKLTS